MGGAHHPAVFLVSLPRRAAQRGPPTICHFPWLADLADVPEDASPPLMMSPIPDDAMCSYGWDSYTHTTGPAVRWGERRMHVKLRWWQRLSMVRRWSTADGSLCWRKEINSAPRRSGKSVKIKVHACWRLEHGQALFGEVQTAIHTGSDMAICREIQNPIRQPLTDRPLSMPPLSSHSTAILSGSDGCV